VCTDNFDSTKINATVLSATSGTNLIAFGTNVSSLGVVENMPVYFDTMFVNGVSVTTFANIEINKFYYVKSILGSTITISESIVDGIAGPEFSLSTVTSNTATSMDATFLDGSTIWKSTNLLPYGYSVGYINIPQIAASNTTFNLDDSGKHYYSTTSGIQILTIPNNSNVPFPLGTTIAVVLKGTGTLNINTESGVELYLSGNSTPGNKTVGSYSLASIIKVEDNVWFINGTNIT
jgi:hypothetical protein